MPTGYEPSEVLPCDTERIRRHSFTRWMSRDLLQATTDFCKNIGLLAIYSECSPGLLTRYLFWKPPERTLVEIRSGRKEAQFRELDQANIEKGKQLLSLHVTENGIYSAVWISPDQYEIAVAILAVHGITPAQRKIEG